ncbi:MAG: hypothetical protein GX802_03620 [Clostridiales bacterium]|nr:hypothetical protein [Clostridiales bacterium]
MQLVIEILIALANVIFVLLGTIIFILFLKGMAFLMGDRNSKKATNQAQSDITVPTEFLEIPKEQFLAIVSAAISEHSGVKGLRIHSVKLVESDK